MPDFTPKKVQQQMYTRERRGIFRSTEGFDTIARSLGLEHGFIKRCCIRSANTTHRRS